MRKYLICDILFFMKEKRILSPITFQDKIVTPGRRILSALADVFSLFIISAFIYTVAIVPIFTNFPSFTSQTALQQKSLFAVKGIFLDGKLMSLDEDSNPLSGDQLVTKYIDNKLLLKDYNDDGSYNDIFYFFYLSYANENLSKDNVNYSFDLEFVKNDIFNIDKQTIDLWDVNYDGPIRLTNTAKEHISSYIKEDVNSVNKSYYDAIVDFAKTNLLKAEKVITESDQYIKEFEIIGKTNEIIFYHFTISSLITYIITFPLYFFLIPFLSKNGMTLGKRIMKINLVTREAKPINNKLLLLRTAIQFISYLFIVQLIPYLSIGNAIISLPLVTLFGGTVNLIILTLLSIIVTAISLCFTIFTHSHQSLMDKLCDVYAIDLRKTLPFIDEDAKVESREEIEHGS